MDDAKTVLDPEAFDQLLASLKEPPAANDALRQAARENRDLLER